MRKTMAGTTFRDSKGIYTWKDERYPSVTTILRNLDKPALPRWAAKSVAEYVAAQCKAKESGQISGADLFAHLQDVDALKGIPWSIRDAKRDIGSTLHQVAEQITLGTPIDPKVFAADIRPYVESFMAWHQSAGVVFEASEMALFNRSHSYAGTCDALVRIGGRPLVLDYKTSSDTYEEHALQLAAYRHAEFIGMETGEEIAMPQTEGGAILLVGETGCRLMEWECSNDEFEVFLALRRIYDWRVDKKQAREVSQCQS